MKRELIRSFFEDESEYLRFLLHLKDMSKTNKEGTCIAALTKEDDRFKYVLSWQGGEYVGDYIIPFRASFSNVKLINNGCAKIAETLEAFLDGEISSDEIEQDHRPFGELTWSDSVKASASEDGPYFSETSNCFVNVSLKSAMQKL